MWTPKPTLLSPQDSLCTTAFHLPSLPPTSHDSDTQPVCSPRPPQILVSIPCVPSSLLPRFKEGAGQAMPLGLHPGRRREFSTNGERHQTGALFFFASSKFYSRPTANHQRGHSHRTQEPAPTSPTQQGAGIQHP